MAFRLSLALALIVALATAGCFGGDEEQNMSPTPTSPTPTPDPTDGDDPAPEDNETEEPAPPPSPQEIERSSFDFSQNNPAQPAPPKAVTVPEEYSQVFLNVTFTPTGGVGLQSGVAVVFTDAGGTALRCAVSANPAQEPETCEQSGSVMPGEGQLSYEGEGLVTAEIVITATA